MEECGRGVSATVSRPTLILLPFLPALCRACLNSQCACMTIHLGKQVWRARVKETGEEVAVKLLDLESVNCSLVRLARTAGGSLLCPNARDMLSPGRLVTSAVSAGGDCEGSADDEAAGASKRALPALLLRP